MKKFIFILCFLFTGLLCFGKEWPEQRIIYISDWYGYEVYEEEKIDYFLSSISQIANTDFYNITFIAVVKGKNDSVYTLPLTFKLKKGDKIRLALLDGETGDVCYITNIYQNGIGLSF